MAENAQRHPNLREDIEAIMTNFDVMARADPGLDEEAQTWFAKILGKELQQLGSLP